MKTRVRASMVALAILSLMVVAAVPASANRPEKYVEITNTEKGLSLRVTAAERQSALGFATDSASLRVWRLDDGDYLVGPGLPPNLLTTRTVEPDGTAVVALQYDVEAIAISAIERHATGRLVALSPSWQWLDQACFSRMGSESLGWLDSCYVIHGLVNESDSRDFFKLEQFGTVGAGTLTKIYSGFLAAVKAGGSSPMSWIDWSPRGNHSGACSSVTLSVSALGVSISAPAFFCENDIPTKSATPGSFTMSWDCECIYPFGQPYPNSREIDYMQAVSVPGGGFASWTLTAGYSAR